MNCCDEYGECRQGRDCPARVAKIKRRVPKHPTPLRQEISRVYLKHLAKWMLIVIVLLFSLVPVVMLAPKGRAIDCSLAEISPDFTPAMREACRKARHA